MDRLRLIAQHLTTAKHNSLKLQGWGYKDTNFQLGNTGQVRLSGNRYLYSGKELPLFRKWVEDILGIDLNDTTPAQKTVQAPPPVQNKEFVEQLQSAGIELVQDNDTRVHHSHGHSLQEIYQLRYGQLDRVVDGVVYPRSQEDVENIVRIADSNNVALLPYGGGTNVTHALICEGEQRMLVSVNMQQMNHVREVNRESMTAIVECGINGRDLERELERYGVCCGHEPDSVEFSTLGGWISTKASGMKKNEYGNIEDIVLGVTLVTPTGTYFNDRRSPRVSTGPDFMNLIIGSEGTLGILVQAVIRVRPLPLIKQYGSFLFPNFPSGVRFMRDCARNGLYPASLRLVDNLQFHFAQALRPDEGGKFEQFIKEAQRWYVTRVKKFDVNQMCAATVVFEGNKANVNNQSSQIKALAKKHNGLPAGEGNGLRGYFLTFMIAYLRDFGMEYNLVGESFETSVPWDNLTNLLEEVPKRVENACIQRGVQKKPFVSMRVTQIYDTGACVYVYFAYTCTGMTNPLQAYNEVEEEAREEILAQGGSLSHHHGIGKLRKHFLPQVVPEISLEWLRTIKNKLDPKNTIASNNLIQFKAIDQQNEYLEQ